jgi:diguanylate cyclase (GGDEF)-like protein/PAS domain S-box-containing protein
MSALPIASTHDNRLHLLVEVLERMAAVRDWPTLMQTVRRAARALTGADGATLVLRDGDQCHYVDEDAIGPLWKHQRFPLEHCISGISMIEGRAIVIPDIRRDPRVPQAAYAPTFVRAMTMVPIGRSEPVGAIGCYWARVYEATAEELRLHQTLADATITAITNIRLNRGLEAARETAERAAAEANAAFEQAAVGMAQLDTQGRCRRVNARLCQILGLHTDDLLGLEFDALHERPQQAREARAALLDGAEGHAEELRLRHADGRLLWVQLTQSLVRGPDGAACGLTAVVEDIGARKAAQAELARSRETFRCLAEMSSDYFWATDAQHRISEVSASMLERSGLDGSRFLGRTRWELPTLDIAPGDWQPHRAALAAQQPFAGLELSLLNVHGERRWLQVAGTPVYDEQGRFDGYRGVTQDVTERRHAEHLLRQQAAVFSTVQEGIAITDLDGRVLATNPAFTTITEYAPDELLGHDLEARLHSGRHPEAFYAARQLALRERGDWAGAQWSRRKSGAVYQEWITVSTVRGADGAALNRIWVRIDLSRMARTETDLEREALHDPLTGLPNRRLLMSRLERALEQARRHHRHGALLYLDLDRFKPVNDVHGHAAGDELLQQVAQRWRSRLREADTLARIGGDEFIVLLEETTQPQDACAVAQSLRQALDAPFTLSGGQRVSVGSSVGLALFPGQADEAAALLLLADQALYAAKRAGRSTEAQTV